jgi:hypothetical protein
MEDFYESLLTVKAAPTYIPTTDGDAALCGRRVSASSRAFSGVPHLTSWVGRSQFRVVVVVLLFDI